MADIKKQTNVGISAVAAAPVGIKVIKKGDPIPDIDDRPVEGVDAYGWEIKEPEDHQSIADRLDYLCTKLDARHYRELEQLQDKDGNRVTGDVILKLKLPDGTVLGGKGPTTAHAFNELLKKVQVFTTAVTSEAKEPR